MAAGRRSSWSERNRRVRTRPHTFPFRPARAADRRIPQVNDPHGKKRHQLTRCSGSSLVRAKATGGVQPQRCGNAAAVSQPGRPACGLPHPQGLPSSRVERKVQRIFKTAPRMPWTISRGLCILHHYLHICSRPLRVNIEILSFSFKTPFDLHIIEWGLFHQRASICREGKVFAEFSA